MGRRTVSFHVLPPEVYCTVSSADTEPPSLWSSTEGSNRPRMPTSCLWETPIAGETAASVGPCMSPGTKGCTEMSVIVAGPAC